MATRRDFLQKGLGLTAASCIGVPLIGCASSRAADTRPVRQAAVAKSGHAAAPRSAAKPVQLAQAAPLAPAELAPPPDIFDAQALDLEFWLKPRTLHVIRPASGEKSKLLYWRDGEVIDTAYQELCHLLRDVNGRETAQIDPKLLETLWGAQAFVARYGIESPVEILSGYRTPSSNKRLIEQGIPAARQSLHMEGKAADIRIPNLNAEVLGGLVKSFGQGGVGFYYREGPRGGWIHADTGLKRTWKG
ncbi:YcbK family protein [Massilia sp. erpn]|uniref:YcbK family protein n=1 Tax=Massilia sp. erpn TaxID=2738142 RepID=UPI0035A5F313